MKSAALRSRRLPAALLLIMFGIGCANSSRNIYEAHNTELSQLSLGMTLEQFRSTMPKAYVAGQSVIDGKAVDAYELKHLVQEDPMSGYTETQRLWFYFSDRKLVKWGAPQDWPTPADLTVEMRRR